MVGLVRLTHPFPSLLDGGATLVIALIAGGAPLESLRLGLGMAALQAAIGAVNDVVDAPRDAGRKPGKPIAEGAVSPAAGTAIALVAAAVGLVLSAMSGVPTALVGIAILAVGLVYDLWLRGTAWSWLPFAVGIPMLPVYAWLGARGTVPELFVLLVPMAFLAGAGLAIANALVDVDRDRAAGVQSVAVRLGPLRAWTVQAMLQATVVAVALASMVGAGVAVPVTLVAVVAGAGVLAGVALTRDRLPARRERGWQLAAVGTALLAVAWIAGLAPVAG